MPAVVLPKVRITREARGLRLWFKFEGNANDSSGLGNNGVENGGPTYVTGKVGQAIDLDGVDDYVRVPYNASFKPASQVSIAAWVKPDVVTGSGVIVENTGGSGGTMVSRSGADLQFAKDHSNSPLVASGVFTAGQWHHVACTYDGAEERIYVNGVLRASRAQTGAVPTANEPLYVGARQGSSVFFDGAIDEVRLYDSALAMAEVSSLYANGALTYIEELRHHGPRRVVGLRGKKTQSIGLDEFTLEVQDDRALSYKSWAKGDEVKIEVEKPDGTYQEEFVGIVDRRIQRGVTHPTMVFPLLGYDTLALEETHINADVAFEGVSTDAVLNSLASTYLSGWDTSGVAYTGVNVTRFEAKKGEKLGVVFARLRKQTIAGTGNLWELRALKEGGTRKLKFYQRDTAVQNTARPLDVDDLFEDPEPQLLTGSFLELATRVTVHGATVPSLTVDKTGLTKAGSVILDATGDLVAFPFEGKDTVLSSVAPRGARSLINDPPTLAGYVMRNSDNVDLFGPGANLATRGATVVRTHADITNPNNMDDENDGTAAGLGATFINQAVYEEVRVWDLQQAQYNNGFYVKMDAPAANQNFKWEGADSASGPWTLMHEETGVGGSTEIRKYFSTPATKRYVRLLWKNTHATSNANIYEAQVIRYKNASAAVSSPVNAHDGSDSTTSDVTTTGGGSVTELFRVDLGDVSGQVLAQVKVRHNEGTADAQKTLAWQYSDDGSTWTDEAQFASVGSVSTATITIVQPAHRHWRLIAKDNRPGGSPGHSWQVNFVKGYRHTSAWGSPLIGDKVRGSDLSWVADNLASSPGTLEEKAYPQPRLAITQDAKYWFALAPGSGVSLTSYWEVYYGTEASYLTAAKLSTDSGATWSNIAANAVVLAKLEYNEAQLSHTENDTTEQAKYATLVQNGVLTLAELNEALTTKEAVEREAKAKLTRLKNPADAARITVPLDVSIVVGKRYRWAARLAERFGYAAATKDWDVVEVHPDYLAGVMQLVLGEHFPAPSHGLERLKDVTSQGRM